MARTRTLVNLRSDVRQRSDMENTTFVADAELTEYINQSIGSLYDLLAEQFGDEYFSQETTLTTAADANTVALPSDFYKLNGLFWVIDSTRQQPLEKYAPVDAHLGDAGSGWYYGSPIYYRLQANAVRFVPSPNAVHSLTMHYAPAPTRLSADGDTFDGYGGWEEYVIWDAAIKCLVKEESDTTMHMVERQRVEDRIKRIVERDQFGTAKVARIRYPGRRLRSLFGYANSTNP